MTTSKMVPLALLLSCLLGFALSRSLSGAEPETKTARPQWTNVQVVTYTSGLTGFFDGTTGRLYLYGSDLKTPFMVTEIETLGEPLKVIKAPQAQ